MAATQSANAFENSDDAEECRRQSSSVAIVLFSMRHLTSGWRNSFEMFTADGRTVSRAVRHIQLAKEEGKEFFRPIIWRLESNEQRESGPQAAGEQTRVLTD